MSIQKQRKYGIRQQILTSFVILCLVSLGSIAVTAAIFNNMIGTMIGGSASIVENLEVQLLIIFVSLWEIIVISLFVGLKLADSVIKPIHKLTSIALKLCTHDLKTVSFKEIDTDFDEEMEVQNTEIGSLTEAFKKLVKKVKEDVE